MADKDVRHIELSLEGSGPALRAGDALGIWPANPPRLVEAVLATLQLDGDAGGHATAARPCRCANGCCASAN